MNTVGHHMTDDGTMIDQERLMKSYNYNPYSGIFSNAKSGDYIETEIRTNEYTYLNLFADWFRRDKIVCLWLTGIYPAKVIHLDGDKSNDSWKNLKIAAPVDKPWYIQMMNKKYIVSIDID